MNLKKAIEAAKTGLIPEQKLSDMPEEKRLEVVSDMARTYTENVVLDMIDTVQAAGGNPADGCFAAIALCYYLPSGLSAFIQTYAPDDMTDKLTLKLLDDIEKAFADGMRQARGNIS